MRIIFVGTPTVATSSLEQLIASEHEVVAVITRPDAPIGRKRILKPSAVASIAEKMGIEVIKTSKITSEIVEKIKQYQADIAIVVAYGALISNEALAAVPKGWLNLHFSLLPKWRGAAPVQRALIAGDREFGISIFRLVSELDAGPIYLSKKYEVHKNMNASEMLDYFSVESAKLLPDLLNKIATNSITAYEQEGDSTYAHKLGQEDAKLSLQKTSGEVFQQYLGVSLEPGAYIVLSNGRLKIHKMTTVTENTFNFALLPGQIKLIDKKVYLGCSYGVLELLQVQPEGKKIMNAADYLRGQKDQQLQAEE